MPSRVSSVGCDQLDRSDFSEAWRCMGVAKHHFIFPIEPFILTIQAYRLSAESWSNSGLGELPKAVTWSANA